MTLIMDSGSRPSTLVACLQAYFVTIATILGTGILGLPVTLTHSGLYPFLVSFLLDAVMQSILIHFFVELLQRACAVQIDNLKEETVPLNEMEEDVDIDENDGDLKQIKLPSLQGNVPQSPNLHLLGTLFLSMGVRQMFDALIILQFVALLVCYALAGSEAYAQLMGVDHFYVIPVFVWVLSFAVVFALQLLQPVISVLTFVKGSVLLATALVTFYVGVTLGHSIRNDFAYIGAPFLMGTVAIGGTINTMPFTFEKIRYKKENIEYYRLAVQLGLWTCVALNIIWCWSVLDLVPQTVLQACEAAAQSSHLFSNITFKHGNQGLCFGELSLESAKMYGEISTVPLTKILDQDYPSYRWVAVLVQVFIVVSITVSYLSIGAALHHTLKGVVQSIIIYRGLKIQLSPSRGASTFCTRFKMICVLTSLVAFIVVFVVAMCDPQGFVDILEKFASLTMNSQAGIFIFLMLIACRKKIISDNVPAPMAGWFWYLLWTLPVFFNAAVVLDIYDTIRDWSHPLQLQPVNITYHGQADSTSSSTTVSLAHHSVSV